MEIGGKLKDARAKAGLTQEQVANAVGVSRQSVSNWETGKTLPDIISVIRLSDLYGVSLDALLKEDPKMLNYLEESTNVVKSRQRLRKTVQISSYLIIWTACLLWFWFGISGADAMGYAILAQWLILPLTTFILSLLIGHDEGWGRAKWLLPLFFGLMWYLNTFSTFNLANVASNGGWNWWNNPNLEDLWMSVLLGLLPAALGMGIGRGLRAIRTRWAKKKEN